MTPTHETSDASNWCQYCASGTLHSGMCPRIAAIDYNQYGQTVRVEFFPPEVSNPAEIEQESAL